MLGCCCCSCIGAKNGLLLPEEEVEDNDMLVNAWNGLLLEDMMADDVVVAFDEMLEPIGVLEMPSGALLEPLISPFRNGLFLAEGVVMVLVRLATGTAPIPPRQALPNRICCALMVKTLLIGSLGLEDAEDAINPMRGFSEAPPPPPCCCFAPNADKSNQAF